MLRGCGMAASFFHANRRVGVSLFTTYIIVCSPRDYFSGWWGLGKHIRTKGEISRKEVLPLKIKMMGLDEIKPYEKNPRKNGEAVKYVAESIKEFGFKVPVVIDNKGVIVAGHTRWKAAKKLGLDSVPCVVADDLTEKQVKAFRLADNKVGEFAKWDNGLLDAELFDIGLDIDMCIFGFDEKSEEEEVEAEVPFTETLDEAHNYIVLYFDNDIDWLQAQSLFDIKPVKEYGSKKDGSTSGNRKGVGRVLNGSKALGGIVGLMQ